LGTQAGPFADRYPLADAAKAHADLASRRTVGKLLLLP
jgi:NADPH2:quinone reductase